MILQPVIQAVIDWSKPRASGDDPNENVDENGENV